MKNLYRAVKKTLSDFWFEWDGQIIAMLAGALLAIIVAAIVFAIVVFPVVTMICSGSYLVYLFVRPTIKNYRQFKAAQDE